MGTLSDLPRFTPGDVILHRTPSVAESGEQPPTICDVRPMTVVEDSETLTSLWLPAGTPTKLAVPLAEGAPLPWLAGEWRLVDAVWDRWNTLLLMVPGQWRATWIQWTPEWEFFGWYVNMEEPLRRTPLGFDSRDLWLDILVDPRRQWRWNVDRDYWRVVRRMHPELDCFESLLVSCDLGVAKPDPEIFTHACRVTGTEPSQCFFVDDTALNVDAAQELGFHGHTFRTVSGLSSALKQANARGV